MPRAICVDSRFTAGRDHRRRPEAATIAGLQADRRPGSAGHPRPQRHPGDDASSGVLVDVPSSRPEQVANLIHEAAFRRVLLGRRDPPPDGSHAGTVTASSSGRSRCTRPEVPAPARTSRTGSWRWCDGAQAARAGHQHPHPRRRGGLPLGRLLRRGRRPGPPARPRPEPPTRPSRRRLEAHGLTVVRFTRGHDRPRAASGPTRARGAEACPPRCAEVSRRPRSSSGP